MVLVKSFVYLVRTDRPRPQLLVFSSLEEPGYEVPKGAVEAGETPLQAAERELEEETGLSEAVLIGELGITWYGQEKQHFYLLEAADGLPSTFEHQVTGEGGDQGFCYQFLWLDIGPGLADQLVQGSSVFEPALLARYWNDVTQATA